MKMNKKALVFAQMKIEKMKMDKKALVSTQMKIEKMKRNNYAFYDIHTIK